MSPASPPRPTCRTCGTQLSDRRRQLCPACWPATRSKLAAQRAQAGNAVLAQLRSGGQDPTNCLEAAAKRAVSLSARKREQLAWAPGEQDEWTRERYQGEIQPRLAQIPLSALAAATGLSLSACSRIRAGRLVPHQRHWVPLRGLLRP